MCSERRRWVKRELTGSTPLLGKVNPGTRETNSWGIKRYTMYSHYMHVHYLQGHGCSTNENEGLSIIHVHMEVTGREVAGEVVTISLTGESLVGYTVTVLRGGGEGGGGGSG